MKTSELISAETYLRHLSERNLLTGEGQQTLAKIRLELVCRMNNSLKRMRFIEEMRELDLRWGKPVKKAHKILKPIKKAHKIRHKI